MEPSRQPYHESRKLTFDSYLCESVRERWQPRSYQGQAAEERPSPRYQGTDQRFSY
jgi:hypothetical protein